MYPSAHALVYERDLVNTGSIFRPPAHSTARLNLHLTRVLRVSGRLRVLIGIVDKGVSALRAAKIVRFAVVGGKPLGLLRTDLGATDRINNHVFNPPLHSGGQGREDITRLSMS
jgi:hypothetical protein